MLLWIFTLWFKFILNRLNYLLLEDWLLIRIHWLYLFPYFSWDVYFFILFIVYWCQVVYWILHFDALLPGLTLTLSIWKPWIHWYPLSWFISIYVLTILHLSVLSTRNAFWIQYLCNFAFEWFSFFIDNISFIPNAFPILALRSLQIHYVLIRLYLSIWLYFNPIILTAILFVPPFLKECLIINIIGVLLLFKLFYIIHKLHTLFIFFP
jgi:hypothetical protein